MPARWRLIINGKNSAAYNMAADEFILLSRKKDFSYPATLRFYQWENPSVSIGYGQPYSKAVNEDFCLKKGVEIVRRPTGGRAVLHHHELTYCLTASYMSPFSSTDVIETYNHISEALLKGLSFLGIHAEMSPARPGVRIRTARR